MYSIIKFIENVLKFLRIKIKIIYWKLKYGKRIKLGKNFRFRKGLMINIAKNGYLEIGDDCAFNNYCSINCRKKIIIGNNNMFGENVKFYDHNHVFNNKSIDIRYTYSEHEIVIGNNNWIASNVTILSKAKLGNYNVVSSNTLLNEEYKDEYIIKNELEKKAEKIKYKKEK